MDLEAASEMAELYWMALCRDVNFNNSNADPLNDPPNNFSGNDLIGATVNDLGILIHQIIFMVILSIKEISQ